MKPSSSPRVGLICYALLVVLMLAGGVREAPADLVRFSYSGTIELIDNEPLAKSSFPSVDIGSTVTGTLQYDPSIPPTDIGAGPEFPGVIFTGSHSFLSMEVGGATFRSLVLTVSLSLDSIRCH